MLIVPGRVGAFGGRRALAVPADPAITAVANDGAIGLSGLSQSAIQYGQSSGWTFGTGDFTIECFYWQKQGGQYARLFSVGGWPTAQAGVSLEDGGGIMWVANGADFAFARPALQAWHHIALVRETGVFSLYVDGARVAETSGLTSADLPVDDFTIGNEPSASDSATFCGYVTNFRLVKGSAEYSGATCTVPTAPLGEITNTNLLLLAHDADNVLTDSCVFNRSPTGSTGVSWRDSTPFA